MSSEVEICKLGLSHLGDKFDISDLAEASAEAEICNLVYAPSRDATLRAYPWNFAKRYASPATISLTTVPGGWAYAYAYPTDCLKLRHISKTLDTDPPVKFEIANIDVSGTDTKVVLTNEADAELVYTYAVTDPLMFDGEFVMAMSYMIAMQACMPLTGDKDLKITMGNLWKNFTSSAQATDANEGSEDDKPLPDWISARS